MLLAKPSMQYTFIELAIADDIDDMISWIQSAACDGLPVGDVAHAMSNRLKHGGEHIASRTSEVLMHRLPYLKTSH